MPLPDHISARPEDLLRLIDGMVAFDQGPAQNLDAIIAAAFLAFGFVYIHPFEDGNGRIHRACSRAIRSAFCHWSNGNRRRNSTSGC
ncbi:Fic family protein [Mesorhizobium caraganae]|uniref:Fic family protein n=1 Tax=Mesorhizobium caraganae TaxID=483206 RepID=UPI0028A82693|nr:Fic family protein [Mesorhizobium caraganae]